MKLIQYSEFATKDQLDILKAVDSTGGTAKAAKKLGVSQRKVQRAIKKVKEKAAVAEDKSKQPRILFWDVETSPIFGPTWRRWDSNLMEVSEDWYMLCYSYKWQGDAEATVVSLFDYEDYDPDTQDDFSLICDLWDLIDEADIIVHHNGDKFDLKKANAKFIEHNLPPYSPVMTIDTLKQARKHFAFTSNKLDDLGKVLGLGQKVQHGGYSLWKGCMTGCPDSWAKMVEYSKQDTDLLELVYNKLVPWMDSTNLGLLQSDHACPKCGSKHVIKRGFSHTNAASYQRYQCNDCGGWSRARTKVKGSGNNLTNA